MTARKFGKQAFAREAEAIAMQKEIKARRDARLAKLDRAYAAALARNPEGNNRNKGNAPPGRLSGKTYRKQQQNHSGTRHSKPNY